VAHLCCLRQNCDGARKILAMLTSGWHSNTPPLGAIDGDNITALFSTEFTAAVNCGAVLYFQVSEHIN
jgi:hypothetical protein